MFFDACRLPFVLIERRSMMSCYHGSKISGSQQQGVFPFRFNPENVANI